MRLTVAALTQQVDALLNRGFPQVAVEGELAQLQVPGSGHAYLLLKERETVLNCIIWRNEWRQHKRPPAVGDRVICYGRLGVYGAQSRYQLYATRVETAGAGELDRRIAEIRARLEADGLLDPRRRRPLPAFPAVIGLATSETGAALQDFLRVSQQRWPAARILLAPCSVQGTEAAASVVRALELLFEDGRADVIVVTRGGGSRLDLLPFSDERLCRFVATSPVPVVSAVGHEIDSPLSDEVADAAAPTPSAAAMRVLPDGTALRQRVDECDLALRAAAKRALKTRRKRLAELQRRLRHPSKRIADHARRREELYNRLMRAMGHHLEAARRQVTAQQRSLEALSPYRVLDRGYALVAGPDGVLLRDARAVSPGDALAITLAAGQVYATVDSRGE